MWVSGQRTRMKAGAVTEQQMDRLTKLGFIWDLHQFKWQRMYEALVAYKLQYGHCDIPMNRPTNPDLTAWGISQRAAQKRGKLSANRFQLLDELSFIWQKKQGHPSLESDGDE